MASKEPVRLRQRRTQSGNITLYLDIYIKGRRQYEYLHLYLVPEKNRADKEKNREALSLAEAVRAKRLVEVRDGRYGFRHQESSAILFYDYYLTLMEARRLSGGRSNFVGWRNCLLHIEQYDTAVRRRTLIDIDRGWILGFRDYLENAARAVRRGAGLAPNSAALYFTKFRCCINQAFRDGLIDRNPLVGVSGLHVREVSRMYLTLEEIRRLADAPCRNSTVKDAFLFSCLSGLRRSDIERLCWSDVYSQGEYTRIIFRQKKTGGQEYLDLAPEAVSLMGRRGGDNDLVFAGLLSADGTNACIADWSRAAGIDKKITFHSGRHTFATLMLDLGTDIYTVSKLLGHRELKTTQIYAKIIDKNKQAAVSRIPSILTAEGGEK